jgi:hypothetical protein
MKKLITATIMIVTISMLSGCGRFDRWWAGTTGKPAETCVGGVNYLQFTSGACVQVDINGKPVPCK